MFLHDNLIPLLEEILKCFDILIRVIEDAYVIVISETPAKGQFPAISFVGIL